MKKFAKAKSEKVEVANADKYISKVNLSDTTYKIKDSEARENIEILKDQKEDKNVLKDLAVSFCLLDGSMDDFTFVARNLPVYGVEWYRTQSPVWTRTDDAA